MRSLETENTKGTRDARIGRRGYAQYVPSDEPRAMSARCTRSELIVTLADGRVLHVPLGWFDRLLSVPPKARKRIEIDFVGTVLHFPDADEDISIERLLMPHRAACLDKVWREHGGRRQYERRQKSRRNGR